MYNHVVSLSISEGVLGNAEDIALVMIVKYLEDVELVRELWIDTL